MVAYRASASATHPPNKLLVIAGGAQHIWIKLRWEANRLDEARRATPFDLVALIYGAMNFAITAQSLEDWVVKALMQRDRRLGQTAKTIREAIAAAVPLQPAFRNIANTAKHGEYRDENWLGGTVELVHTPAFAGTDREYVLIYHAESGNAQTSLDIFDRVCTEWLGFLTSRKLVGSDGLELSNPESLKPRSAN